MKTASRKKYGSPSQIYIEHINTPRIENDEVLIKVHATTVNRTDCANLTAKPFIMRFVLGLFKPRESRIGTDYAGEIIEVGKNITRFKKGDRVMGFDDLGLKSQAEFIILKQKKVFLIPDNIDFVHAAASMEGAHYAYGSIHKVNLQPGQHILINGATGAIGSALLQFAKQYEVNITATCNTKNIELIRNLGADKIYDYTKEDFTQSSDRYDFIFDAVGKSTFGQCKPLLKNTGIYISSELGPYAQNIFFPLSTRWSKKKVIFPIPYSIQKSIPYIIDHLKGGTFTPIIDRTYQLSDLSKAYEYVLTGQKTGNVTISMQ